MNLGPSYPKTAGRRVVVPVVRQGRLGTTVARLKPKGIGGSSNKRRNMLFNSTLRETPHQCLLTPR